MEGIALVEPSRYVNYTCSGFMTRDKSSIIDSDSRLVNLPVIQCLVYLNIVIISVPAHKLNGQLINAKNPRQSN